ncbi:hypothetical protein SAMN02745164_00839 [Marinitoga hydrogenitolerans DSM 16785]|uniref:Uncharacterized protein n=1 Tax=Marinitoga hydrogenitolerans (strain DSM 16785 / JCM 12826 / AT1271) TaxID=1122195 RepID=A0A1M4V3X1_MARH1|nr:hypothetical protein [Marinitoga hydrogenitolerans]SHE63645.1 hypothetical protein SAMN02745164_00839 [Marinitoga hydrogenitolerans DSM 16785]
MSDIMLKIFNSKINFPDIEISVGEKIGIYTQNPDKLLSNLLKIIIKPKKYTEEYILEGMDAENLSYFSRRIFHVVSSELWNEKNILKIIKKKTENRKITIISAKDINMDEILKVSLEIEKNLSKENIMVITNSKEFLEAVCDKVIDENGNSMVLEEGTFIKRLDNMEEIENINEVEGKYIPLLLKKRELNVR